MGKKRSHSKEKDLLTGKKQKLEKCSTSFDSDEERVVQSIKKDKSRSKRKHKSKSKTKHKKKKSKVVSSSSECSSEFETSSTSSTSSSSSSGKRRKKPKKKRKHKSKKSKSHKLKDAIKQIKLDTNSDIPNIGPLPPEDLSQKAKSIKPMTKEEWEKSQSVVKRVYDEESGRHRLIKGDGEVLEEIVSRERQKEINRHATEKDGSFFQNKIHNKLKHL